MPTHDALYYPFSRCLDIAVLKQLLLLFDSITFIDPVDDEYWRSKLIRDIEHEHQGFEAYRSLADCLPWLRKDNIVRVADPQKLSSLNDDLTVAATLSDLSDPSWTKAADPRHYGLPTQFSSETEQPCWNIFRPKMPTPIAEALRTEESLSRHLFADGGERYAWSISYEAGSAIGINVHLAAAEELNLAPVTDSRLHHELMLAKLARDSRDEGSPRHTEAYADQVAQHAIVKVLGQILPNDKMEHLSLEDILRFREETTQLRRQFLADIRNVVLSHSDLDEPSKYTIAERKVVEALLASSKQYADEIANTRDRLWPKLIEGLTSNIPMGATVAGLAASYIAGSGYVLAASVLIGSLQPLKAALEWRADVKKTQRSASNAIAYLSQVKELERA